MTWAYCIIGDKAPSSNHGSVICSNWEDPHDHSESQIPTPCKVANWKDVSFQKREQTSCKQGNITFIADSDLKLYGSLHRGAKTNQAGNL